MLSVLIESHRTRRLEKSTCRTNILATRAPNLPMRSVEDRDLHAQPTLAVLVDVNDDENAIEILSSDAAHRRRLPIKASLSVLDGESVVAWLSNDSIAFTRYERTTPAGSRWVLTDAVLGSSESVEQHDLFEWDASRLHLLDDAQGGRVLVSHSEAQESVMTGHLEGDAVEFRPLRDEGALKRFPLGWTMNGSLIESRCDTERCDAVSSQPDGGRKTLFPRTRGDGTGVPVFVDSHILFESKTDAGYALRDRSPDGTDRTLLENGVGRVLCHADERARCILIRDEGETTAASWFDATVGRIGAPIYRRESAYYRWNLSDDGRTLLVPLRSAIVLVDLATGVSTERRVGTFVPGLVATIPGRSELLATGRFPGGIGLWLVPASSAAPRAIWQSEDTWLDQPVFKQASGEFAARSIRWVDRVEVLSLR